MTCVGAAVRAHLGTVSAATALLLVALLAWSTPGAFGGWTARITNGENIAGTAAAFTCTEADAQDRATAVFQWPLTDTGATAVDLSGAGRTGTHVGGTTTDASLPIACPRDAGPAWSLDGSTQYASLGQVQPSPTAFTLEVWFRTSVPQGRLIGFGSSPTGASLVTDRHLYIASSGALVFGVAPTLGLRTLSSGTSVADGAWHQAVATLSGAGAALYLDGVRVATDPAMTAGQTYANGGYWRVGYDSLALWPGVPTLGSSTFSGRLRFAAVYTSALSAAQVAVHYRAGT